MFAYNHVQHRVKALRYRKLGTLQGRERAQVSVAALACSLVAGMLGCGSRLRLFSDGAQKVSCPLARNWGRGRVIRRVW
jgi:hypothetical protein